MNPIFVFEWYLNPPPGVPFPEVDSLRRPVAQPVCSGGEKKSINRIINIPGKKGRECYLKLRRFGPATGQILTSPIVGGYLDHVEVPFQRWPLRPDWLGAIHETKVQLRYLGDSILASAPVAMGNGKLAKLARAFCEVAMKRMEKLGPHVISMLIKEEKYQSLR